MASTITNPFSNFRKELIKMEPVDYHVLKEERMESDVDRVSSKLLNLKLLPFTCSLCKCVFEAEKQLTKHIRSKQLIPLTLATVRSATKFLHLSKVSKGIW